MALTIPCDSADTIELDDFIAFVEAHVDIRDEASLAEAAPLLRKLANNRALIVDRINRELGDWATFQADNNYTSQTIMLGGGSDFYLRANMWLPPASLPHDREWQDALFFYRVPHDHNFSFLTVGYLGSGYETTIWEYDRERVRGEVGEAVPLRLLERTTLGPGKVMLYRACRDVHSQEHPRDCSISLNLIASPPEVLKTHQFLFDTDRGTIAANVHKAIAGHIFLCTLAQHVGNAQTATHLDRIAHTHNAANVRLAAAAALASLEPASSRHAVWQSLVDDGDAIVRRAAARALQA